MKRVAILMVGLFLTPAAAAQVIDRPFLPDDPSDCEASWERNNRSAEQLLERLNACNQQCTDRVVAGIGTAAYTSTCGGRVPYGEPGHGSYRQCAALDASFQKFLKNKSAARSECLAAVERISATQFVAGHSDNDAAVEEPVSGARKVTSTMRDRTTTGSGATDRLRDESTRRAENVTASMMKEGIEEIEAEADGSSGNKARRCRSLKGAERKRCLNE